MTPACYRDYVAESVLLFYQHNSCMNDNPFLVTESDFSWHAINHFWPLPGQPITSYQSINDSKPVRLPQNHSSWIFTSWQVPLPSTDSWFCYWLDHFKVLEIWLAYVENRWSLGNNHVLLQTTTKQARPGCKQSWTKSRQFLSNGSPHYYYSFGIIGR